jgi:acyl-CoA thioesterase FadM
VFPWLRLLRIGMPLINAPRVPLLDTTCIRLRVWPNDLDFNLHVNNGRYLTLADLGRIDWFTRTGLLAVARRHKAFPVVGDAIAKFRRDLRAFQSFEIHTRMVGWDDKWGCVEHRFVRAQRVLGAVVIRGVFKGPDGPVSPQTLLEGLSLTDPSPPLPSWATDFNSSSDRYSKLLREEEQVRGQRPPD